MAAGASALSRRLFAPILNPNPNPPENIFITKILPSPSSSLFRAIKCTRSSLSCSAIAHHSSTPPLSSSSHKLRGLVDEFRSLPSPLDRVKLLLRYASALPPFPDPHRSPSNRVMGCTAAVWLSVSLSPDSNTVSFLADSDSELTRGFCACLISVLDGATPEEVMAVRPEDFADLDVGVGLPAGRKVRSRANTWHNVLVSMQKRTRMLVAAEEGRVPIEPFPSLVIGADGIKAKGSYAEAQVR